MGRVKTLGGAEPAPAARVSDEVLERAAEETRRFGLADRIHYWDKKQGAMVWVDLDGQVIEKDVPADDPRRLAQRLQRSPEVILCGHDKSHGALVMHASGSVLMCCKVQKGAGCTFTQPVSI